METKLVAITKPIIDGLTTPGEFIAYAARVSNPSNQMNTLTAPKLLKYLVNNAHWSPFEMVSATFEITTTRDIARQILRHRSFSFQEFSQRYADPTQLGFDISEARLQDTKNRQNSIEVEDGELSNWWYYKQQDIAKLAEEVYADAIAVGIAKEQARKILPEGLTVSKLYMAGTIRSWIHYCSPAYGVRYENGTQKEHKDIARSVWPQLVEALPELSDLITKG